jgi:uncharacterized protein with von Willebrand factor type A (vWA) domain
MRLRQRRRRQRVVHKATLRGSFAAGTQVIGIAVPLNQL